MASKFQVGQYEESMANEWDAFVLGSAVNGTILQARRFLSYHPDGRFEDSSLVVRKGNSIVAVVPACAQVDEGQKIFKSHGGSTFGGLIVDNRALPVSKAIETVALVNDWLADNGFNRAVMKQTPDFFSSECTASVEYALQHEGYSPYGEISFVADMAAYGENVEDEFTASRRRDCRYGQKAGCVFVELTTDEEVAKFYDVLVLSLQKFETTPVHTLEELLEFKNDRLKDEVRFYGVELDGELIAGSMVFLFRKSIFHTQYLAAHPDHLDVFPMNYMDWNLIKKAQELGYPKFSFGISTEEHGRVLNSSLAAFKEGFGGIHSMNWTFTKEFGGGK